MLLLFFTAVVLETALNQLVQQFQRLGIRRGGSVLLSLEILFITFIVFIWLIVPILIASIIITLSLVMIV